MECVFCGVSLFVDRSGIVGHYLLPRLLDADQARAALKRWMAGNDTVKDLDRKSSIEAVEAITFPVWMFRSRQKGGEAAHIEPAAATPIPQIADLKIPAGELQPYEAESGALERAQATVPMETARGWLSQRGVENVFESSLVALPLWRCRYSLEGFSYQAFVDGSTGEVMATVFPEKAEAPYYLVAGLGMLVFVALGLAISNPAVKLLAYAMAAVPLTLAAYWVTRKV